MRYLPHTEDDVARMLATIGVSSIDDLIDQAIPSACKAKAPLNLPPPLSEWQLNAHMDSLAANMSVSPNCLAFLGAGSYQHHIPASVQYLLGRSEFTTSYTPYQPEMSQGTLQAVYEFQSLCCRLLYMDVATASHYDGATALAEAILIALKKTRKNTVAISRLVHPLHRRVIDTYLRPVACRIVEIPMASDGRSDIGALAKDDYAAVVFQSPNFFGCIEDLAAASATAKDSGALFIVSFTEPLAYGICKAPGTFNADIVTGEGQSLGIPSSFGGPGLGILSSTNELVRSLPGRLAGQTTDINGQRGFVLTLATREQHIRREKATSNICSNNGLCAVAAAMYMASLGGSGFKELARLNRNKSEYLKKILAAKGFAIPFSSSTFNEFVVDFGADFQSMHQRLQEKGIIAGLALERFFPELKNHALLCVTEVFSKADLDRFAEEVSS